MKPEKTIKDFELLFSFMWLLIYVLIAFIAPTEVCDMTAIYLKLIAMTITGFASTYFFLKWHETRKKKFVEEK